MARTRTQADLVARIRQMTGKMYPKLEVAIESMDEQAVMDLIRMLSDLRHEQDKAVRNAQMFPWRGR